MHITRRGSTTFVALICCIICAMLGIYYGLSQQGSVPPKDASVTGDGAGTFGLSRGVYINAETGVSSAPPETSPEPVPRGRSSTPHPAPIPRPHAARAPVRATSGTANWSSPNVDAAVRPVPEAGQTTTATATF
jgi:hypothetical protein